MPNVKLWPKLMFQAALRHSANVDVGLPSGTIVGIFEHDETCAIDPECEGDDCEEQEAICLANTLRPGSNLVASCYALYSSSTFLVLTMGFGTYAFTLDDSIGEFVLSQPSIQIPETSTTISFNEAKSVEWDGALQGVVEKWKNGAGKSGNAFSSRYCGSVVGDVHRILLQGGVFGSPADKKNPNGKLHLLYECAPLSFLVEQAGGVATTGKERIMDIQPQYVHQRVPIIMGSKSDVQEIVDAYAAEAM